MNTFRKIKLSLLFILALIAGSCSVNPVSGKKELSFMSESQEMAIGQESDPSVIAQFGLYPNDTLKNLLTTKGDAMVKVSHRPDLKFTFRMLDSPILNAFAVPGGYVYFTRGIMAYFNDEAQFAGVLGHEIGHVTARHASQQYTKQMLTQIAFMGGMIFSEKFRGMADQAMQGMQLLFLKFSRDDESQSDVLGVKYSSAIGYDANQMADFFQTLQRYSEKEGARVPEFLSTHPDPGNRYSTVKQLAKDYQTTNNLTKLNINRDQYLRMIDGLVYGEDPRQGYLDKTNYVFYQPEMRFEYPIPNGWQYQNSPMAVQAANASGDAAIILTMSDKSTFDAAASEILQAYGLKNITTPITTKINGLDAYTFTAEQVIDQQTIQQNGGKQPTDAEIMQVLFTFYKYDNKIYVMQGMSSKKDFPAQKSNFLYSMNGFKPLTDPKRINVIPERIKIVSVANDATLKDIMVLYKIPADRYEEVSILNGMQQSTLVKKGMLVKMLEKKA